jgi:hypothetical protein
MYVQRSCGSCGAEFTVCVEAEDLLAIARGAALPEDESRELTTDMVADMATLLTGRLLTNCQRRLDTMIRKHPCAGKTVVTPTRRPTMGFTAGLATEALPDVLDIEAFTELAPLGELVSELAPLGEPIDPDESEE